MTTGSTARVPSPDEADRRRQEEFHESLVRLIQANTNTINRFLERVCSDRGLAEDALQEALIEAWAQWEVVSGHERPLFWVRKAAWYKLQNLMRSQQREVVGLPETEPVAISDPTDQWQAEQELRWLLRQLPLRPRAVLALAADGGRKSALRPLVSKRIPFLTPSTSVLPLMRFHDSTLPALP